MLHAVQLTCVRGERTLFEGLDFKLEAGVGLWVAGANGSGKTSLLRLLCGLAAPAAGEIRWHGEDIRSLREEYARNLVYIGHASAVKDDLTAHENLLTSATLGGVEVERDDARQALARIGLGGREDMPARFLSQGQRRRVVLARLLLSIRTPLWLLDEPFTALDRAAVDQLRATVAEHLAQGGLAVFTTHQEVELGSRVHRVDLDRPC